MISVLSPMLFSVGFSFVFGHIGVHEFLCDFRILAADGFAVEHDGALAELGLAIVSSEE